MTKDDAIQTAVAYLRRTASQVGPVVDAKYFDHSRLADMASDCPPDLVETYRSVVRDFRNRWVVTFQNASVPGQVSCPETTLVCVFENGEATLFGTL